MINLHPKLNLNGWDEMFGVDGIRQSYREVLQTLQNLTVENLTEKQKKASEIFLNQGITFTVYSDKDESIERIFPFDIIPRIITKKRLVTCRNRHCSAIKSFKFISRRHLQWSKYC